MAIDLLKQYWNIQKIKERRIKMYSYEIEQLLKLRNNLVSIKEYLIITSSPQIDHIKYDNGLFYLWTNDNYKFVLKIRKEV